MSDWELKKKTERLALEEAIFDGCIVLAAIIAFAVLWWWLV